MFSINLVPAKESAKTHGISRLTFTFLSILHPLNADEPMHTTESGISTERSFAHPENAASPITSSPCGRSMLSSFSHPKKAQSEIDVTPSGMSICVKLLHLLNDE